MPRGRAKAKGRPKQPAAKQIRWIYDTVTIKNPLQFKLAFASWTRAKVRALVAQRFLVKRSLVSVRRLLAQLGLTWRRPLFRAYQQDRPLVERWMKEEYPKIRTRAKRENAEIFLEDKPGVRSDFHTKTTWAPKGWTPVVWETGQRLSLNMISAISARGELRFIVVREGIGATAFIALLKRLVHGQGRPIHLIVEGHPSHRAKKVKSYVEALQGKLRLIFPTPCFPELTPDKLVWSDVKNNGFSRTLAHGLAKLFRAVVGRLRYFQNVPEHVRSLFRYPETRHAYA